jgi:hypothetical protein
MVVSRFLYFALSTEGFEKIGTEGLLSLWTVGAWSVSN